MSLASFCKSRADLFKYFKFLIKLKILLIVTGFVTFFFNHRKTSKYASLTNALPSGITLQAGRKAALRIQLQNKNVIHPRRRIMLCFILPPVHQSLGRIIPGYQPNTI